MYTNFATVLSLLPAGEDLSFKGLLNILIGDRTAIDHTRLSRRLPEPEKDLLLDAISSNKNKIVLTAKNLAGEMTEYHITIDHHKIIHYSRCTPPQTPREGGICVYELTIGEMDATFTTQYTDDDRLLKILGIANSLIRSIEEPL